MIIEPETPIPESNAAQTAIASAATLAAIAVLGCVLAYWTWIWLAPRPEPRVPNIEAGGTRAAAALLFGTPQGDRRIAAPTGVAMKLLGVAAASPRARGYAVVQVAGKDIVAIREGADIIPGIRLAEVHRDRVVLDRNGLRETLEWPRQSAAAPPSVSRQNAAASPTPVSASTIAAPAPTPPNTVVGPPPTKADRDRLSD